MNTKIISIVVTLICISSIIESKKNLMCWYRQSEFPTQKVFERFSDSCTHHILLDFYGFNYNEDIESQLKCVDSKPNYLEPKIIMQIKNPTLKFFFSYNISRIYESEKMIKKFTTFLIAAIKNSYFDGVELTSAGPSNSDEALNYITMLRELNKLMKKDGFLLVHRIPGDVYKLIKYFKLAEMEPYVDYFVLETFHLHSYLDGQIGVSAPLSYSDNRNVRMSVYKTIELGIPRNKLILGLATYGVTFLVNHSRNFIGMPSTSPVKDLPFPRNIHLDDDSLEYNKICKLLSPGSGWTRHWDHISSTPYLTNGKKFITYDDKRSFVAKLKYLKDQKLGGAALFNVNYDDDGTCSGTMFFLTDIIRRELDKEEEEKIKYITEGEEVNIKDITEEEEEKIKDITKEEDEEPIIPVKIESVTIINTMY